MIALLEFCYVGNTFVIVMLMLNKKHTTYEEEFTAVNFNSNWFLCLIYFLSALCFTLHTYFDHGLHVCLAQCSSLLIKTCLCFMCVLGVWFYVSVESVRPHLASHYFCSCSCMTELILKALFLAQNIPSCLCTGPSRPIHFLLSKTSAVICCFLYT